MRRGKRPVSVDSTLSDLYTTLTPPPPGNRPPRLLGLKASVHTGRDRPKHREPLLGFKEPFSRGFEPRGKLRPGSAAVDSSISQVLPPFLVYNLNPRPVKVSLAGTTWTVDQCFKGLRIEKDGGGGGNGWSEELN